MAPRDQRCEKARDVSYGDASYWGRRLGLARHVFSRTGVLGVCFVMTDMTMHGRVVSSRDIVTSVYCALGPGIEHLQRWSSLSYKLLLDAYNVYMLVQIRGILYSMEREAVFHGIEDSTESKFSGVLIPWNWHF